MTETTSTASEPILNIAAYKFVPLDRLEERRRELRDLCARLELRGTILLSREGINLFLAGLEGNIAVFLHELRAAPEFADLETKESTSEKQPFRRMLVRLKNEIIAFGVDGISPGERTSPKLPARELKRWLDEGRPVRLLDVRNEYEVELGTFAGAEHLQIGHFREFPEAIEQLPAGAKTTPLVMFCTGGIRCEKAGPLMEQAGYRNVYQLDGGILKYFEECGSTHYDGNCFVFDGRVALDPNLKPTGDLLCFACQAVVSPAAIDSAQFLYGQYCPRCYRDEAELTATAIGKKQLRITEIAQEQRGCTPYTHKRRIFVPGRFAGYCLLDFLCAWHPGIEFAQWQRWIEERQIVRVDRHFQSLGFAAANEVVREGECFEHLLPNTVEPPISSNIELLHEDESLVVINKPAPLPVHPSGRFNKNTLSAILEPVYPNEKLRIAHRLDANTTGVVVLCRKHQSARFVQPQFAARTVDKVYLARVYGQPTWDDTQCDAKLSDEPSESGGRRVCENGQPAMTNLRVLQRLADGTTIVEARPRTGRTHQIRLHLWHLGHAIVGDPMYLCGGKFGQSQTLDLNAQPMYLHAASIRLQHPQSRDWVTYTAPAPEWFDKIRT